MQSHSGPARLATLVGSLAAVLAAFTRWLTSRLSRLLSPRGVQSWGLAGAAVGRFVGRFEMTRESLATPAQCRAGYNDCAVIDGHSGRAARARTDYRDQSGRAGGGGGDEVAGQSDRAGRDGISGQSRGTDRHPAEG